MDNNMYYYESKVQELMEEIISKFLNDKPKEPAKFLLNYLIEKNNLSECIQPLNKKEMKELDTLKAIYKKIETNTDKKRVNTDSSMNKRKRVGISSECYSKHDNNNEFDYKPIVYQKSTEEKIKINEKLKKSILFKDINIEYINIIIDAMQEENFEPDETIIKEGNEGDKLYIVEFGEIHCYKKLNNSEGVLVDTLVKKYYEGDSFGEIALMHNTKRLATLIAITKSKLWSLDRQTFHYIFKKANIDRENMYVGFLKNCDLLKDLDDFQLKKISEALEEKIYKKGETIILEGEEGDSFYILELGEAHVCITKNGKNQLVKEYKSGDYFGELALLTSSKRKANVIAYVSILLNLV